MARNRPAVEHLLRRAGFGASPAEIQRFEDLSTTGVLDYLLDYEEQPDDVDTKIGQAAYASVFAGRIGGFQPAVNIEDARQRWLFRMIHSSRPLQEKMALFWHNHFATAYSKLNGEVGPVQGAKMFANKRGEMPGPQGQLELFRQYALGNFRDLLVEVSRDPAMLVWLDGRLNTRVRPQENFGREIMELFTFGVGNYTEQDVYAAARVFTGWNLRFVGAGVGNVRDLPTSYYEFVYNPAAHDTTAKAFTFPIYRDGSTTIPARAASAGMQDGLDFINALATHPQTARRLATKLWNFFISEVQPPDEEYLKLATSVYLLNDTEIRPLVQFILRSRWFQNPANWYSRYSWPAEFAVRAVKEVGWTGFSVEVIRQQLGPMGQVLFEPPDVAGWELGQGWYSTGNMLARMNFAATLAQNQRFNLARDGASARSSPEDLVAYFLDRLSPLPYDRQPYDALVGYLRAGAAWTGSDAQLQAKAGGLARLIVGSSEYQLT
jgi:uncharacterized protein (DUF1800 family)